MATSALVTLVLCIPLAVPLLPLAVIAAVTLVASQLAAPAIDALVLTAEHARLQKANIQGASSWCADRLIQGTTRYWVWLQLMYREIDALVRRWAKAMEPAMQEMAHSHPTMARFILPLISLAGMIGTLIDQCYTVLHDEIVPVALDLVERLAPYKVQQMLLRHAMEKCQY